ncbi:fumarylacetoacetate hydrolase family protein [Pseudonocardia sp. C8]|nr:fumarylacetoacetate hydrolase family protein [Pseudonocardia sp. C8]
MLNATARTEIAASLRAARAEVRSITAPSKEWDGLDVESAIEIQKENVAHAVAAGDRVVGYKLGNIAEAMQSAFGLNRPDYGHLLAGTFRYERTTVDRTDYVAPYVELEPAFVLGRDLQGPNVTVADVITAVDHCLPAIEIIDSRCENWEITLPDTLADNGSTGSVILGGRPRRLDQLAVDELEGTVLSDGVEVARGSTSAILGNPLSAVAFVCNTLSGYGIGFHAGDVVLAGSCLAAVPMEKAGQWAGHFAGWGSVEFEVR